MSKQTRLFTLLVLMIAIAPIYACGEKPQAADTAPTGTAQSSAPPAEKGTPRKGGPVAAPPHP